MLLFILIQSALCLKTYDKAEANFLNSQFEARMLNFEEDQVWRAMAASQERRTLIQSLAKVN
jgi:hypothetical protein